MENRDNVLEDIRREIELIDEFDKGYCVSLEYHEKRLQNLKREIIKSVPDISVAKLLEASKKLEETAYMISSLKSSLNCLTYEDMEALKELSELSGIGEGDD